MNNAENSSDFAFLGKMGGANREVDVEWIRIAQVGCRTIYLEGPGSAGFNFPSTLQAVFLFFAGAGTPVISISFVAPAGA